MLRLLPFSSASRRQRSKVVFLHAPKTGGTTFSRVLQRIYGESYRFFDDEAADVFARHLEADECTEVHITRKGDQLTWGTKNIMQESNWRLFNGVKVFVMFREPVAHYISSFYHSKKFGKTLEKTAAWHQFHPDTLDEYLESPRNSNLQIKFLLGIEPGDETALTEADLEHAKRLISTVGVKVGILERYSESLHLFENVTGAKIPLGVVVVRNKNRVPQAERVIDDATRQRIQAMNALDQQLYDYAVKVFEDQIAGCGPCPRYRYLPENSVFVRCRDWISTLLTRKALQR